MKKILFSVLILGGILASCSKDNTNNSLVHIKLGAGVNLVGSKAPITDGSTVDAGIAGWESKTPIMDYAGAALTWETGISVAAKTTAQAVTWTKAQYYNADENTTTYIKSWHPKAAFKSGSTSEIEFTNTNGDIDAMLAPMVSGTKSTAASALAFEHKTAQINFKVQAGAGLETGTTLTSIAINGTQLPVGFNLATDAVVYDTKRVFTVPGITNLAIIETAATAGNPIMISPTGENTFTVNVVTNKATYANQTVTIAANAIMEQGTAYEITLTFGQAGISLTATVAEWKKANGSGTIQ